MSRIKKILLYGFLIAVLLTCLYPIIWMIMMMCAMFMQTMISAMRSWSSWISKGIDRKLKFGAAVLTWLCRPCYNM